MSSAERYPFRLSLNVLTHLRPQQNGQHFTDEIFKRIFFIESFYILIWISLEVVPKCLIDNESALVQVMAQVWSH